MDQKLEHEPQPELQLPGRTERVDTCTDSNSIYIVPGGGRSVNLTGGSGQQPVQGGTGQVKIGEVEEVVEASTWLDCDPFSYRVGPRYLQIQRARQEKLT